MDTNTVIIQRARDRWLNYSNPVDIVYTSSLGGVCSAMERVEDFVDRGFYAAGFVAYEAAPAFDSALSVFEFCPLPLLWFGIYKDAEETDSLVKPQPGSYCLDDWVPDITENDYLSRVENIREYIRAGDTYQVNYTMRLKTRFTGDPYSLFHDICKAQRSRNCAFINTAKFAVCSASPELFLAVKGTALKACPMKGTARRGLSSEADVCAEENLRLSEKDRAENVMIVDMMRNDLGRIAEPGSVHVSSAFDIERYPTVLQMTSTVRAVSSKSLVDIMKAMFPCSSITGAPKVRTMEIIRELETSPRGIYTGTIGCIAPGNPRKALFNVAIRTILIDKKTDSAEYGVGGGIVWDSVAGNEYAECLDKVRVLTDHVPDFKLLETMRWTKAEGYYLMNEHLDRVLSSAKYFDIPLERKELVTRLIEFSKTVSESSNIVRLLIGQDGCITLESRPIDGDLSENCLRLGIASTVVNSSDKYLYHKTTFRTVYENARKNCPGCDDVILHNDRGEVTETTIANIVVVMDGRKLTPPVDCGLLPGTFRKYLLEKGEIEEKVVLLAELKGADEIYIINSVRGYVPAQLIS